MFARTLPPGTRTSSFMATSAFTSRVTVFICLPA
jgi:hypothetical protein